MITTEDEVTEGEGTGRRPTMTERASQVLDRRLGRRGFLARAALAGSAMTVAPLRYLLKPGTAYAAICGCSGRDCDCGSSCCDGYTEFCCTLTGVNGCPPGSVVAGWWKADGSGLCAGGPRFYMDCNASAAGPCGASGVTPATNDCGCDCAGGNCGNRKSCCTAFRYGQCSQHVPCLGPIVCRVVSCVGPWLVEPSCTGTPATDEFTRFHDAPCLSTAPTPLGGIDALTKWGSLPAVYSNGLWYRGFDNINDPDMRQLPVKYGEPGYTPVTGDWNGDGSQSLGVWVDGMWHLTDSTTGGPATTIFPYGANPHRPVAGTWTGAPNWGIGLVWGNYWMLRYTATPGEPEVLFNFGTGAPDEVALVGDWDGDGIMTPGVVNRTPSGLLRWDLRNSNTAGPPDISFHFGLNGDVPVAGDWNADRRWGPGVVRGGKEWFLRNDATEGLQPDIYYRFNAPRGIPLSWASRIRWW